MPACKHNNAEFADHRLAKLTLCSEREAHLVSLGYYASNLCKKSEISCKLADSTLKCTILETQTLVRFCCGQTQRFRACGQIQWFWACFSRNTHVTKTYGCIIAAKIAGLECMVKMQ
jgi:hypothetical protein